jgi:cell wall-associated NlpC family hydrolase
MFELLFYAKTLLGVPYVWGGDNPFTGFDCSGYVQYVLKSVGEDPKGDQTAQGLYNHYSREGTPVQAPQEGALIFYGTSVNKITHVALAIDKIRIIEAGGGGRENKSIKDCKKNGACVRERPYNHRKDLVAIVMPRYNLLK